MKGDLYYEKEQISNDTHIGFGDGDDAFCLRK